MKTRKMAMNRRLLPSLRHLRRCMHTLRNSRMMETFSALPCLVLRQNTSPRKISGLSNIRFGSLGISEKYYIICFIFTIGVANRWDVFYRGQYKIMISHRISLQRLYSASQRTTQEDGGNPFSNKAIVSTW